MKRNTPALTIAAACNEAHARARLTKSRQDNAGAQWAAGARGHPDESHVDFVSATPDARYDAVRRGVQGSRATGTALAPRPPPYPREYLYRTDAWECSQRAGRLGPDEDFLRACAWEAIGGVGGWGGSLEERGGLRRGDGIAGEGARTWNWPGVLNAESRADRRQQAQQLLKNGDVGNVIFDGLCLPHVHRGLVWAPVARR